MSTRVHEAAERLLDHLSEPNFAKTRSLADARRTDPSTLVLDGQTFDVKIPRYLLADLISALWGLS